MQAASAHGSGSVPKSFDSIGDMAPPDAIGPAWMPLFVLGATVFAGIWSRFFRCGPLEHLLNAATTPARYVR